MPFDLPSDLVAELVADAEARAPHEACGLLTGPAHDRRGASVDGYVPLPNRARSSRHFEIDPIEFLTAIDALDASGRVLRGIFHSHPDGPPAPSDADLRGAWPGLRQVICALRDGRAVAIAVFDTAGAPWPGATHLELAPSPGAAR